MAGRALDFNEPRLNILMAPKALSTDSGSALVN
jgi:hypothetical protein